MKPTLGMKIALLAAASALLAAGAVAETMRREHERALREALGRRAETIATVFGLAVANDILQQNVANVEETARGVVESDAEILLLRIFDLDNRLLFSRARDDARASSTPIVVRRPILVRGPTDRVDALGVLEIHFTTERLRAAVDEARRDAFLWAAGAAAISIVLSLLVSARIAGPVRRLHVAARKVAAGDLTVRVAAETGDEVGRLAREFDDMVGQLRGARESLERRVRDLAALYDAARIIQSSDDLDEVLGLSLEALSSGFGFAAAAVAVTPHGADVPRVEAVRGFSDSARGAPLPAGFVGEDVRTAPEAEAPPALRGLGPVHVAPLRVAGRTVGALLAAGGGTNGDDIDRYLAVLAGQVGPAVEVAALEARARAAAEDPFTPFAGRIGAEIERAFHAGQPVSIVKFRHADAAGLARRDGWAAVDGFLGRLRDSIATALPQATLVARCGPDSLVAVLPAHSKAEARAALMGLSLREMDDVVTALVTHPQDGASATELLAKV